MFMMTHEASPGGKSYCFPHADVRNKISAHNVSRQNVFIHIDMRGSTRCEKLKVCVNCRLIYLFYVFILKHWNIFKWIFLNIKFEIPRNSYTIFKRLNYISECFNNTYYKNIVKTTCNSTLPWENNTPITICKESTFIVCLFFKLVKKYKN